LKSNALSPVLSTLAVEKLYIGEGAPPRSPYPTESIRLSVLSFIIIIAPSFGSPIESLNSAVPRSKALLSSR